MSCSTASARGVLIVISIIECIILIGCCKHVSAAPQQFSQEKNADLTVLIDETLKINNKSSDVSQNFRDDWTFDRVEYDLMDFLKELNARYQNGSSVESSGLSEGKNQISLKQDAYLSEKTPDTKSASTKSTSISPKEVETQPVTQPSPSMKQTEKLNESTASSPSILPLATSVLPISIATGDHDISESTWQYGIFDRFTRPRASTTTSAPTDLLISSATGASLDVRSFNSDECGLRSYRQSPDYFPQVIDGLDTDEVTKELSQRRQRPPALLESPLFASFKKNQSPETGNVFDKLLPPLDHYGEPAPTDGETTRVSSKPVDEMLTNTELYRRRNLSSLLDEDEYERNRQEHNSNTSTDSEFNLSSRRQWLQQQLGSTLQALGFNNSHYVNSANSIANYSSGKHLPHEYQHQHQYLGGRENMMKMSAANILTQKLGKSLASVSDNGAQGLPAPDRLSVLKSEVSAAELANMKLSGPEVTEQELKARQDELKLEARVIGGNDARLGDSPWSVSLQALVSRPGTGGVEYRHYCGGTIIAEFYILTAAHCLDFMVGRESRLFVVVGDLNWRMSAASVYGRRFGIEKLIIHGGYKSTAFGHDIGLIRTKESMKPLKSNGRYIINSVCLPERNVEHSGEAELVGWGLFSNRNEMADSLQIADVPILPRPLCVDLYRRRTGLIQWLIGIELITEKQICAGTFGRGICQGDSGSALVFNEKASLEPKAASAQRLKTQLLRDSQQRATIIGVVAFGGIRRCSYQSLPGVYMQTSKYLDWILPRIQ